MKLELIDVKKKYGDVVALKGFNYSFEKGIYAILGANGAGKSTLFNLLTDNLERDEGKILLDDVEILSLKEKYRATIGYMPQQQGFYEKMTAISYLEYVAYLKGMKRSVAKKEIEENLKKVNLWEDRFKRTGAFSGGMRQRLLVCATLLSNPSVLILDEPSAGLDPKERVVLRRYIGELSKDKIILIATHIVSDIETIADKVLIMKKGELLANDSPAGFLEKLGKKNLEEVYMHYCGDDEEV